MFSGIIIGTAHVLTADKDGTIAIQIESSCVDQFSDVVLGESVAVNGVCLTVTSIQKTELKFFASSETLSKTNLQFLKPGQNVNLERALKVTDRLSGHIVQGHVDQVGELLSITPAGEAKQINVSVPENLTRYMIDKGSITLDGISLTINAVDRKAGVISLMIIPHTWMHTSLSSLKVGHRLNIEVDVIAKYVESLTSHKIQ